MKESPRLSLGVVPCRNNCSKLVCEGMQECMDIGEYRGERQLKGTDWDSFTVTHQNKTQANKYAAVALRFKARTKSPDEILSG